MYSVESVYAALPDGMRAYYEKLRAMHVSGSQVAGLPRAVRLETERVPVGERNMLLVLYLIRLTGVRMEELPRDIRMLYGAYSERTFEHPALTFKRRAMDGDFDPERMDEEGNVIPGGREPLTDAEYYAAMERAIRLGLLWSDRARIDAITLLRNLKYAMVRGEVGEPGKGGDDLNHVPEVPDGLDRAPGTVDDPGHGPEDDSDRLMGMLMDAGDMLTGSCCMPDVPAALGD